MTFRNPDIDKFFSNSSLIQKYLDVEVALAKVQADLGLIPAEAAKAIASNALLSNIDMAMFEKDFDRVGFPIVGLIKQLGNCIPDGFAEYLHWGATTQDIMDTSLILVLEEVCQYLEKELDVLIELLQNLAEKHKSSLMVGRSQLQQATPITFGYKVAGWLAPIVRYKSRLHQIKSSVLQVQFGGAVGTLASLGEIGFQVREKLGIQLKLESPNLTWHTQRDTLTEFMSFIAMVTTSLSKIAQDILFMTQSEVRELTEKGEGKSSTMPNKRNPVITQKVLVAGKMARSGLQALLESSIQDHERGTATWQMEWNLIPSITSHGFYALKTLNGLLKDSLEVNTEIMLENLSSIDTIYAEALMMELAPYLGRQKAHDLVDVAITKAQKKDNFKALVLSDTKIINTLSKSEIEAIFSGKIHVEMAKISTEKFLKSI